MNPEDVPFYREALAAHQNNPQTHVCTICGVRRCATWREAAERLARAGELIGLPKRKRPADTGGTDDRPPD